MLLVFTRLLTTLYNRPVHRRICVAVINHLLGVFLMIIVFITPSLMNNKPELLYNSADTQTHHYLPQCEML